MILAFPKLIFDSKGKNIKTMESALLNPKYISEVNSIYIGDTVDSLHFIKTSKDNWLCTYGDLTFYAENKIINQLIEKFSKTITLISISDSIEDYQNYGLTTENAFNISFYSEDSAGNKKELTSIYFGNENSDNTMIYLRSNKNPKVYSMENNIYSYFSTNLQNYGILEIFPIKDNSTEKNIDKVEIIDYYQNKTETKIKKIGDESFKDYVHTLFSLRGATFYSEDILQNSQMKKIKTIKATDYKNNLYFLDIFSYTNTQGNEQFFVKSDFPYKEKNCNYVLEISSWTKSRFD